MSLAPEKRIEIVDRNGVERVQGWTGSRFETIAICYSGEAGETLDILNRVLKCQERDLLDAKAEGG